MNMMTSLIDSINPCIGCTSLSCSLCKSVEEVPYMPERKARKAQKPAAKQEKPGPIPLSPLAVEPKPVIAPEIAASCGFATFTDESYVRLPYEFIGNISSRVILVADGDGMRNAGISSGDYLIFTADFNPVDGDIVLATVDGTKLCRRIFRENEQEYRIRREDDETPDVITKDCVVHGVLVTITHRVKRIA